MLVRRLSLLVGILFLGSTLVKAQEKQDTTGAKKLSPYEKLFKDKKNEVSEGMITLRKMDGKVYFEFPKKLLEKKMLLSTAIATTSNSDDAAVGERPQSPLPIYFTEADSTIHLRLAEFANRAVDGAANIRKALKKNTIGPILDSFKIKAVTPDSSAVVFDATNIFLSGDDATDPFGPYSGVSDLFSKQKQSFKKGLSTLDDIAAYDKNVTVTSYLSFGITSTFMGFKVEKDRPATYQVKHTLVQLPDDIMRPRHSDPRIGVAASQYSKLSPSDNGIQSVKYAHRWALNDPITFYIDNDFPEYLVDDVIEGVEDWNRAFARIGYPKIIRTEPFPEDDPDFSPENTSYSTINYVFSGRRSGLAQSWVDPRSGEILSAAVNIYKGTIQQVREDLFLQTSAADKRTRTADIPDKLVEKAVRDIVAHQVGHTLGLTNNYGASSAIPVDSLRSPTFTQKYGITPSIMDGIRYNFVAQPGDIERGVKMTPNDLGVYDYYAISWLYKDIPSAVTPEDEIPVLERWISNEIDNPMYRYRKKHVRGIIDPQILATDLGDDPIKATDYALKNLKFVLNNMNDWVEDEDYRFRTKMNFAIINIDFFWYIKQVYNNVAGVYQYQKFEGDPYPAYQVVSKDQQRKSVEFLLKTLEELAWLDNAELEKNMNSINGDASLYMQRVLFRYLLDWGLRKLEFAEQKSYQQPYTTETFLEDVFAYVWKSPLKKETPGEGELTLQVEFVNYLLQRSPIKKAGQSAGGNANAFTQNRLALLQLGNTQNFADRLNKAFNSYIATNGGVVKQNYDHKLYGFNQHNAAKKGQADVKDMLYYLIKRSQSVLNTSVEEVDGITKQKYQYLLMKINKALKTS